MEVRILDKYNDLKHRVENSYKDNILPENDYNLIKMELNCLLPYLDFGSYENVRIFPGLIENKLDILKEKFSNIIKNKS